MPKTRLLIFCALLACALLLAACGEELTPSAADRAADSARKELASQKPLPEAEPPVAEKVTPSAGEADIDTKPKVPKGEGDPPAELVVQDLIEGTGPAVKSGDTLTVHYVGVLFDDGKEFDSSWGEGREPFTFTLPSADLIDAWNQGLLGMKAGGRRKLIVPASLGYGSQGSDDIPPNAALIFDIDLQKIE